MTKASRSVRRELVGLSARAWETSRKSGSFRLIYDQADFTRHLAADSAPILRLTFAASSSSFPHLESISWIADREALELDSGAD